MTNGDIMCIRMPTDLDYLAAADTSRTVVTSGLAFQNGIVDNLKIVMVDVTGRNTVRKVVIVACAREVI